MTFTVGPISEGTDRLQDLAPAYLELLGDIDPMLINTDWWHQMAKEVAMIVATDGCTDNADLVVERIVEEIDERLPEGFWFGSHEGDGALIGVWAVDAEV
jgi:hypothetical protein